MAADGSLKFDTKIDTSDFDTSISTLEKALDRLSKSVDKLSGYISKSFQGVAAEASTAAKEVDAVETAAGSASKQVESIGDAAEKSERQVKSLQEQMDAIDVQHWNDNEDMINTSASERSVSVDNPEVYGYDKAAMEFIEQYGKKMADVGHRANEFRQEIELLQGQIKQLESQGLYFGDEEYDEAYLKLQKIEQALKDYKKELTSPTPDANPFGTDTIAGRVLDLQIQLQKLEESGKSLGNAEYDELCRKLAIAREEAKEYAAELAKTPKMVEKENQLLAAAQARQEAAAQKEAQRQAAAQARIDARIAKEEKLLQAQLAKSAQEAIEKQRLEGIASAAQISSEKVIRLRQELERLKARQADLERAGLGFGHQEYDDNAAQITGINAKLSEYKNEVTQGAEQSNMFAMAVKQAFGIAGGAVAGFGKKLRSQLTGTIKQAVSGLKSLFKPANKASTSILKLSNMFKLMLIRMAMRAAIQGVKEGMQNLVQYSSEANQSMSSLASGATYLNNSFAAAFAPILSVVAPILNTLIDLLATALSYINQFFAALGGSTTFVKAKKVNEDYAKSIKSAGGAAKQAGKDAQKALAPFDELTVLQEQASSGSGGGGSGGIDSSQMFETAAINDAVSGFADQIRQAFEAGDWKELGTLIGQKFNEIVDEIDWSGIGHKIGYGVNGAVQTAYYALKAADFRNLGNHVAELLNGAMEEIDFTFVGRLLVRGFTAGIDFLIGLLGGLDWGLIGKSVGDFLRGAFNESYEWITGIDWSQMAHNLYSNIKEFLLGVDFASLAESFFTALGAAIWAAIGFLGGFFGSIGADIKVWWDSEIQGQNWKETASNLLSAIGQGFVDIGSWVFDNIVDPFCAALLGKDVWGDVKQAGSEIWNGIKEGMAEFLEDPIGWLKENIVDPFVNGFKELFGIHSPSTVMAELGSYLMEGLLNKITEMMPDVVSRFGELKENISSKWDEIKAAASEKWSGIQSDLSGLWNGIKESAGSIFGKAGDSISKVWEDVKKKTSESWGQGGIQGVISGAVSGIVSGVEGMVNAIIRTINGLINNINKLSIDIPDTPFSEGFTLGFNIPTLSEVHLPRLASGTVVPPRAGEFAAILGDNNREAEVVSPISTMKQAFREILEEMQGMAGGDIQLTINLDGKVIYNDVVKRNQQTTERTGKNPLLA